jgi:hypothetical protein
MFNLDPKVSRHATAALLGGGAILSAQRRDDINQLPANFPVPLEDGACDHLVGMTVPVISLPGTSRRAVTLANVPSDWNDIRAHGAAGRKVVRCGTTLA